jgi:hypothetical protein
MGLSGIVIEGSPICEAVNDWKGGDGELASPSGKGNGGWSTREVSKVLRGKRALRPSLTNELV